MVKDGRICCAVAAASWPASLLLLQWDLAGCRERLPLLQRRKTAAVIAAANDDGDRHAPFGLGLCEGGGCGFSFSGGVAAFAAVFVCVGDGYGVCLWVCNGVLQQQLLHPANHCCCCCSRMRAFVAAVQAKLNFLCPARPLAHRSAVW